jgi:hypothetical protein
MFILNTAAAFGQAPKTDRQILQKQATAQQHELRREKPRSLFPPSARGNVKSLRASQATAFLLDSAVTQMNPANPLVVKDEGGNQKTVYSYNAAGNVILKIYYDWDAAAQAWKETERFGYDDNGNEILYIDFYISTYWDEQTQQYIEREVGYKDEYAYDRLNWETLSTSYRWENGQWVGSSKRVYEYTDLADSYTRLEKSYQWSNGEWQINSVYEYTYAGQRSAGGNKVSSAANFPSLQREDANGNVTLQKHYSWGCGINLM